MHVSRPVLREALRALSIMKVVDIRQGAGTYVTALEPQQLVSHLDFVFSKDTVALAQVLETRRVVEVGNVRLAARRIGPERLPRLGAILAELRCGGGRCRPLQHARHRVPRRRVRGCRQLPAGPVHEHHQHAGQGESRAHRRRPRSFAQRVVRDHERIVRALRAHDEETAARSMEAHLHHVEVSLAKAARNEGRGPARFRGPPSVVFDAICDPAVLMAVIPGCEKVRRGAPRRIRGKGQPAPARARWAAIGLRFDWSTSKPAAACGTGRDAWRATMGSIIGRADLFCERSTRGTQHGVHGQRGDPGPAGEARLALRGAACGVAHRAGPACAR